MLTPLIMPLTIYRGLVFEDYICIPNADGGPQDLTGYTFKAELSDKPSGTTLATFTVNPNVGPVSSGGGWVQIRLDNSATIADGYYRGTWSLLASADASNPVLVAAGPVDIVYQGVTW